MLQVFFLSVQQRPTNLLSFVPLYRTLSLPWHQTVVRAKLHVPDALFSAQNSGAQWIRVWTGPTANIIASTAIRTPNLPARSLLLYRQIIGHPDAFSDFVDSPGKSQDNKLKSGHDNFLPHPLHFNIHWSF